MSGMLLNPFIGGGSGPTPPPSSPMAFLSGFNGTNNSQVFDDEGPYSLAITPIGNTKLSNGAAKFGTTSLYFDGTGDGANLQYSSDFEFGSGPYTVDLWINPTSLVNYRHVIGRRYSSASGNVGWCITLFANGTVEWFSSADGTTIVSGTSTAGAVVAGSWQHIALDVNASGVGRLYVNGVMKIKITGMPSILNNGHSVNIGLLGDGSTYPFLGYMDEIRIVKGSAEYDSDAGFTPPTGPYTRPSKDVAPPDDASWSSVIFLLGSDNTDNSYEMYDDKAARVMYQKTGASQFQTDSLYGLPFGRGCFEMSGGAFFPDSDDFAFGTDKFTVEAWAFLTSASVKFLAASSSGTTAATSSWSFGTSTSGNLELAYSNGTTRTGVFGSTTIGAGLPPLRTWCHIAADRDASGVFRLYLNGKKIASDAANTAFVIQNLATPFTVGNGSATFPVGALPFIGGVRDLRITRGVARYATDGTFTVPKQTFSRNEATAPSFSVAAAITTDGFYAPGDTLTATATHNGRWTAYQWSRNGVAISGATSRTYTLVSADIGANIGVVVSALNFKGTTTSTAATVGPVAATQTFDTGALAPHGDMQSGSDRLIPAGDMQSGGDVLLWKERTA